MNVNQENLFLGQLPKRLVIGCVAHEVYSCHYSKNPFNFAHYDLNFMALYVDGQQTPAKPLPPNFSGVIYSRSYVNLFISTGQFYQDEGNAISWADYPKGYTLYAFELIHGSA